MSLQSEVQAILDIEAEGRLRLDEARQEAQRLFDDYREKARALRAATNDRISRRETQAMQEVEEEIVRETGAIQRQVDARIKRLQSEAEKARELAIATVLSWLREGG